ncbi:hypothetical protein OXIME_001351 [Oxyplasma meridianum]|uniref:Uncharacterized protein n=1 Tax=Oxyplasma meridianum TaxID=3073602 RepID=A0AAX4NIV3_9ARCH
MNSTARNTKDLEGPGISKCKTAAILADRRNECEEISALNAKTIVSIFNLKKVDRDVYLIA